MGIKEIASGRSDTYRVKITDLHIKEGWNSRVNDDPENIAHVEKIARSIAEVGVKQPLKVSYEGDRLYVTDGHCRYQAVQKAIAEFGASPDLDIPVIAENSKSTEADRVFSQIVMNSGKPLTPVEQSTVFQKLIELGWSKADIAAKAGFSSVYVTSLIDLASAPKALKSMIQSGAVSSTLAISTIKNFKGDAKAATEALKDAVKTAEGLGKARATAKHVAAKPSKEKKSAVSLAELVTTALLQGVDWSAVHLAENHVLTFTKEDLISVGQRLKLLPETNEKSDDSDIV